jgi:hypothetical protein
MTPSDWVTDPKKFQISISDELDAVKDRVRHLIGDRHWGEEGRYKETVLKNILRRNLPNNVSVGSGLILKKEGKTIKRSRQIDIIVYDNSLPAIFSEGDFIITTPENVKGIIEVKTSVRYDMISDILKHSFENSKFLKEGTFNGIFSYDQGDITADNFIDRFTAGLKDSKGTINHICLGKRLFSRFFKMNEIEYLYPRCQKNSYYGFYNFDENLSPSYFISNLVDFVCSSNHQIAMKNRDWLLFPLKHGKAPYSIGEIEILGDDHPPTAVRPHHARGGADS